MPLTSYYYNSSTGAVQQLPTPVGDGLLHLGIGWHGPFGTKQEALDFYGVNAAANPGWKAPTGWVGNITSAPDAVAGRVNAVKDTIGNFDIQSWFLRIGEILLGIVLIGVGIAKLTGTTNLVAKAVKAAI